MLFTVAKGILKTVDSGRERESFVKCTANGKSTFGKSVFYLKVALPENIPCFIVYFTLNGTIFYKMNFMLY